MIRAVAAYVLSLSSFPAAAGPSDTVTLRQGRQLSQLGLGVVSAVDPHHLESIVKRALEVGLRILDVPPDEESQLKVGQAIRSSKFGRADVQLIGQLADDAHGFDEAHVAIRRCLRDLRVDYVDLFLMGSPATGKIVETWDAMVEMRKSGLARSVGVAHFGIPHLKALEKHGRELPEVNRIELTPQNWLDHRQLFEFCQRRGILIQVASPSNSTADGEEAILAIAKAKARSSRQVLLRWALQKGMQLMPASEDGSFSESLDLNFELAEEEMESLSSVRGRRLEQDVLDLAVDIGDLTKGDRFPKPISPTEHLKDEEGLDLKTLEL